MKSRPRSPGIGPEFHLASFLEEVLSDDSLLDDGWTVVQSKDESFRERRASEEVVRQHAYSTR